MADLPLSLIKNTEPLSEEFLPERFPVRHELVQELSEDLARVRKKEKPLNVWLHGPPGAGKTSTIRMVLGHLESQGIRTAYVNCWSSQTFYSVLDKVFDELRALVAEMRDASFKFDRLVRIARESPLVIVLDEVDQMFLKERNAVLYNLSRLDHSGLVCLSETREAYLALDARVKSRLLPTFVQFAPYSRGQLTEILHERADHALLPNAWCMADLERIAEVSGGDARIAIQTLRTAAYLAEKSRVPQIRAKEIHHGLEASSNLRRHYFLKSLSEHHRLLYHLVKEAKEIKTSDLWRSYRLHAPKRGLQPMERRTFSKYKLALVNAKLLDRLQGKGRGNREVLRVI